MKIDIKDILFFHENGFNIFEIAIKLNCSKSTIQRRLKENNISLKKFLLIDEKELRRLYKSGMLIKDISKIFNCSISAIRLKIKEYNIKLNTNKIYFIPHVGQKFNKLEFIEEVQKKSNKKYWKCECECGKIKTYDYYSVLIGTSKSCGCYQRNKVKEYNWSGYMEIPGLYWNQLKNGARRRNIVFDITKEYVWNLYEKQNRKCKLSNLLIGFETKNNKIKNFQASLDRIDNNKGYIEGNVQWIIKEINYMKNKLNEQNFIDLCRLINNYKKEV